MHRRAGHHDLQAVGKLQLLHVAVGEGLFIGADITYAMHYLAGNAVLREVGPPLRTGAREEELVYLFHYLDNGVRARKLFKGGTARVLDELRQVEELGKFLPLTLVVVVKNAYPLAVCTPVELAQGVRRAQRVKVALAAELRLVRDDTHGVAPDAAGEERGVHKRTLPRPLPAHESHEYAGKEHGARRHVAKGIGRIEGE